MPYVCFDGILSVRVGEVWQPDPVAVVCSFAFVLTSIVVEHRGHIQPNTLDLPGSGSVPELSKLLPLPPHLLHPPLLSFARLPRAPAGGVVSGPAVLNTDHQSF